MSQRVTVKRIDGITVCETEARLAKLPKLKLTQIFVACVEIIQLCVTKILKILLMNYMYYP